MAENRTLIIVALIGVTGTLGAAIIANFDKLTHGAAAAPPGNAAGAQQQPQPQPGLEAPHAPPIDVSTTSKVWGENTKLLSLAPGQAATIDARDLTVDWATYPTGSCAGPVSIAYTWQVRQPYPQGGDLAISSVVLGGKTEQVGMGAMGSQTMGTCDTRIFKNQGLEPMKVEVRYASFADADAAGGNGSGG